MDCEWRSKVDPYVDAELPAAEAAQMETHVRTCASCAAEALGRSQMKRAVRNTAIATFSPRPEFRLNVQAAISEKAREKKEKRQWFTLPRGGLLKPAFGFASAAIAAIVVAIGLWLWLGFYQGQRQNVIGELADLHVATLASANPVDVVSTDRHTVKPWFAGKLPFTFNLPEFGNTEFRLVGGRVTYLGQTPGAQLLFAIRKHQISVFIFQNRDGLDRFSSSLAERHQLQFTIDTWAANGLRYFVISDVGPDDIHALSNLLKTAAGS